MEKRNASTTDTATFSITGTARDKADIIKLEERQVWKNRKYLDLFEDDLRSRGISEKTVRRHLANVDCYINGYLLEYEQARMNEGCQEFAHYITWFYIPKDLNACAYNLHGVCASVKKFYHCMLGNGFIAKNQYEWLTFTIKTEMDGWLEELDDYDHNDSKSKCLGG